MPTSTPLGINTPVPGDIYSATGAFGALATSADQAIGLVEETTRSYTREQDMALDRSLRDWVAQQIAAAGLAEAGGAAIDAAVQRVLESQEWKNRQGRAVLVEDFGAKGDGVTDDTAAIQAAFNNAAKAPVEFRARTYKVSATLNIPSGLRVYGNGATLVGTKRLTALLKLTGAPNGVETPTVGTMDSGATTITTSGGHGLVAGELFRLVGQRQIASSDAPADDRLGMATGNTNGPWAGEYLEVREVLSPTQFTTASGLIFNGYRADKSQETHPQARERTTINKMQWHTGSVVAGFTLRGDFLDTIRADYCRDLVVADIRDERTGTSGAFVQFTGSYRCAVTGSRTGYPNARPSTVQYYERNLVMIVSSQACVVDDCKSTGGGQVVDGSYLRSYMIPCIAPVVRNCNFTGFEDNGVTMHPGVWGAVIEDNDLRVGHTGGEVASGIGCRAPYSTISRNKIRGVHRTVGGSDGNFGNYGIQLYDAGGHHTQINDNDVTGFDIGIGTLDGNEAAERHGTLYVQINGNQIADCQHGVRLKKAGLVDAWSGVAIQTNHISMRHTNAVGINLDGTGTGRPKAPAVIGNFIHSTGTNTTPIFLGSAVDPVLVSNVVTGGPSVLYRSTAGASNGTIALAANVVSSPSGVTLYPPPGTGGGGSIAVRPHPTLEGVLLIGD